MGRRLAARIGGFNATLDGGGAYGVGIAAAMWLLAPVDRILKGFPAHDFNALRLSSPVTHLVLWAAIAAVFARLASRFLNEGTPPAVILRLDDYRERLARQHKHDAATAKRTFHQYITGISDEV